MKVRISILPKTKLGWWSLGLAAAMPILFLVGMTCTNLLYKSVPAGGTILKDIIVRPALALTMLAGMASGISAFVIGLITIIRQRERALLVYGAALIGALLIIFLLGEFIFPH
jgi:hypothetical protein